MILPSPRDPQSVVADLKPILPLLWKSLEAGNLDAHDYFDSHREAVDRTLYPCLVRHRAIRVLEHEGVDAKEFERESLANNGIEIHYRCYRIRVLKGDEGEVPAAGHSTRKQDFYCQTTLFGDDPDTMNLILVWDSDATGITGLTLAYPLHAESSRSSIRIQWKIPLPHPADDAIPAVATRAPDDEDLPITLRNDIDDEEQSRPKGLGAE